MNINKTIGEILRENRERKGLLLRQVAAMLDIDTAILSKVERGERKASKEQILKLANILELNEEKLLIFWLADQVAMLVANEKSIAEEVFNIALKKINKLES